MSQQLNRQFLKVNNRTGIVQEFQYVEPMLKSVAKPSVFSWANRGKGVQGETVNSQNVASKQIINKRRKAM